MNQHQVDVAVSLLIESACRALKGDPMSEKELMDRFDAATDPTHMCIDTALETARRRQAEFAGED